MSCLNVPHGSKPRGPVNRRPPVSSIVAALVVSTLALAALAVAGCNDSVRPPKTETSGQGSTSPEPGSQSTADVRRGRHASAKARAHLRRARTWMYQIQGLEESGAVARLGDTDYDLLVVDPTETVNGNEDFDMAAMVGKLGSRPDGSRRLVLAYIDIGQAESYRTYWRSDWRPPGKQPGDVGVPDYILAPDSDGWDDSYVVAFWRRPWQEIWVGGRTGMDGGRFLKEGVVQRLAEAGFDGVYLDRMDVYDDEAVVKAARADGVKPSREMLSFVEKIKAAGSSTNPDFIVMAQNAPYLIDEYPVRYERVVDGLAAEDTWFSGRPGAGWDDPSGAGVPNNNRDDFGTQALLRQYKKYQKSGIPVFTVDYVADKRAAKVLYIYARRLGLRPLATRVSLDRLTATPPPPETARP